MMRRAAGDHVAPLLAHGDATSARWTVDVAVEKVFLLDGWRRCAAGRRPRLQSALQTFPLRRAHAWVKSGWSLADAAEGKTLNIDRLCLQADVSLGEGRFALESHLAIAVQNGSLHIVHANLHVDRVCELPNLGRVAARLVCE